MFHCFKDWRCIFCHVFLMLALELLRWPLEDRSEMRSPPEDRSGGLVIQWDGALVLLVND